MNKIANAVGGFVAMLSLNFASMPVRAENCADELLMDRLISAVSPDFAARNPDLGDHSFKQF